ncbi:hypothetical protein MA16_Dca019244 [Dendrobium catenatum]|uniref:Secreted protein n=1 Tax=Dendrobium catenatum TaxID=906689 RepID=A0A2I0W3M6_9ASPA|nr:hypothetical protein MA16_Dca019244 [Dendrobium catenatum]
MLRRAWIGPTHLVASAALSSLLPCYEKRVYVIFWYAASAENRVFKDFEFEKHYTCTTLCGKSSRLTKAGGIE